MREEKKPTKNKLEGKKEIEKGENTMWYIDERRTNILKVIVRREKRYSQGLNVFTLKVERKTNLWQKCVT